jgi:hypothetical protein
MEPEKIVENNETIVENNEEILQKIHTIEENLKNPVLYVSKKEFIVRQFFTVLPFVVVSFIFLWLNYDLRNYVKQRFDYFVETQNEIQKILKERKHNDFSEMFVVFEEDIFKDITDIHHDIDFLLKTETKEHSVINTKLESAKDDIQLILERLRILDCLGRSDKTSL